MNMRIRTALFCLAVAIGIGVYLRCQEEVSAFGASKTSLPSKTYDQGDTDFLVLGGGTGGLGYAGRVTQAAAAAGKTVTLLEAGRFIHPYLESVTYTIDGKVYSRMLPINWAAFVDAWLGAYARNGIGDAENSNQPANLFFVPYSFLEPERTKLVEVLRGLLRTLQDPSTTRMSLKDIPSIELTLSSTSNFGPGVVGATFIGNPVALLDDVHSDIRLNQLSAGYGNSEDLFYHDAYYTNGPNFKMQNYPRGKTLGGSSIANAQVHFGMTWQFLESLAKLLVDSVWGSELVRRMVSMSTTITCDCDENCLGPVFGMCMPTKPFDPEVDPVGSGYNRFLAFFHKAVGRERDPGVTMADQDREKRMRSSVATRSENPYSQTRSSSADMIANVMGLGISVCFYPHPNPLILSEKLLPTTLNCDFVKDATLRIRTGTLITNLLFDEDENNVSRCIGAEWVYEEEQKRPDQNRMYNNLARRCRAKESLYGNGLDNTLDCLNRAYQFELPVDTQGQLLSEQDQVDVRARAATASGVLLTLGLNELETGRAAAYQRNIAQDVAVLPELQKVNSITARHEVALAAGAAMSTSLLMRAGISRLDESRRLRTKNRANLATGQTLTNNYEYFFQPLLKNITTGKAKAFALEMFLGADTGLLDAFERSYLTHSARPDRKTYTNREQNFNIRNFPRMCSNGRYEINEHHWRTFLSTFSSTVYSFRDTETPSIVIMDEPDAGFLPMAAPGFMPELTGSDDARFNTATMKLPSTHPLAKISWMQHNSLSPERCQCWFESVHAFMTSLHDFYPDVGFESVVYTRRLKSFNSFLSDFDTAFGTGSAKINQTMLNAYFDDETNPIIAGYNGDKTDLESFCATSMMVNSGHHIQGGAIMGTPTDDVAVTDSRGKVYNVRNLRVTDISVFPIAPDGNPWVSVLQLGTIMALFAGLEFDFLDTERMFMNADPEKLPHPYARLMREAA